MAVMLMSRAAVDYVESAHRHAGKTSRPRLIDLYEYLGPEFIANGMRRAEAAEQRITASRAVYVGVAQALRVLNDAGNQVMRERGYAPVVVGLDWHQCLTTNWKGVRTLPEGGESAEFAPIDTAVREPFDYPFLHAVTLLGAHGRAVRAGEARAADEVALAAIADASLTYLSSDGDAMDVRGWDHAAADPPHGPVPWDPREVQAYLMRYGLAPVPDAVLADAARRRTERN